MEKDGRKRYELGEKFDDDKVDLELKLRNTLRTGSLWEVRRENWREEEEERQGGGDTNNLVVANKSSSKLFKCF